MALAATALAGSAFMVPLYDQIEGGESSSRGAATSGATIMRGNYMNTGSKDAKVDPDWDLRAGVYKGYKKGRKREKSGDSAPPAASSSKSSS